MLDWIKTVIRTIGYPGIAMLMILENIFPPIPSEIIMPLAGFVSVRGDMSFIGVVLAGTIGSILGTLPFYYIGRRIGEERLKEWTRDHGSWLLLSVKDIERAARWFERHGKAAVLLCRLVPGVRTWISIPAGFARMPFPLFLVLTFCGTALWVAALTYAGRILGRNYDRISEFLGPVSYTVIGGLLLYYLVHVSRRLYQKSR